MSAKAESEAQGGRYLGGDEKAWWKWWVLRCRQKVLGQLHEHRGGGREFQILEDATEKLW